MAQLPGIGRAVGALYWRLQTRVTVRKDRDTPTRDGTPRNPTDGMDCKQTASYGLVQATVGVGTVLIWDFSVAITKGGGGTSILIC